MTTFIDLSLPLNSRDRSPRPPRIDYVDHEQSARRSALSYGLRQDDFRNGQYAAIEHITLTTHDTTHLDAPYHFGPNCAGKPARTIDRIPLEWCFSDGVVLNFVFKKKGENISRDEVQSALGRIGYTLKPLDIVLIRTDCTKYAGEPDFAHLHPGVSQEATRWLIDQGIKVMGIDAWGWDRSLDCMVQDLKLGHREQFWESHYLGQEFEYCHLERLANLDGIPVSFGFKVSVFPISIEGASAGWVRAVAIID
jgi:kynurenine formamidase